MRRAALPSAGLVLLGGITLAAAAFGLLNWRWLHQRTLLERTGIAVVGRIDGVSSSHKACNSTLKLSWADSGGTRHAGRFATCFSNLSVGEPISLRYLRAAPDIAMIEPGQGGVPDRQFRTGVLIGVLVVVVMGAVTASQALATSRRRLSRRGQTNAETQY